MENILYFFLFVIAGATVFTWGVIKGQRQNMDLMTILYTKAQRAVVKALKKKPVMTRQELEKTVSSVKASLFYSRQKAVVQKPEEFCTSLLDDMVRRELLNRKFEDGTTTYRLTEHAKEKLRIKKA